MGPNCECPECRKRVKPKKIKQHKQGGFCYHECYKCHQIFAVTPT